MKEIKDFIKSNIILILIIIVLGTVSIFLFNKLIEVEDRLTRQETINQNNFEALNDSMNSYIDSMGRVVASQLGFIHNLQNTQSEELTAQGFQLKSLQEITFKIPDMILKIKEGQTAFDSIKKTIDRSFFKDAEIVTIKGNTHIDLLNDLNSNTELSLSYKDIGVKINISQDENYRVLGTVTSDIPGLKFINLKTTIDDSFSFESPKNSFWDKTKIGLRLGSSGLGDFYSGVDIDYSNYGLWYLSRNFKDNIVGVRVFGSFNEILKIFSD